MQFSVLLEKCFLVLFSLSTLLPKSTTALQPITRSRGLVFASPSSIRLQTSFKARKSEISDDVGKKKQKLFFVKEKQKASDKKSRKDDDDDDDEKSDGVGIKAAAATGTTLAAARTASTVTGGIAATTASVTSGSTTTAAGTTAASTIGAARGATSIVSTVAATTASVTSGSTTATTTVAASSGLAGARIGTTLVSGVGASSITTAASTSSTSTAVGSATSAAAGARAATGVVGASVLASGGSVGTTTTSSSATAGTVLGAARVTTSTGVGAAVAGKSGSLAAGRGIPFFATTVASSSSAIKGGAASRLAGAGAAALASTDIDALTGGAIAVDASTTSTGLGEALAGAGSEMLADATGLVGDAIMDGVSTVGSAVADVAVGVATDTAIGSGTVWGIWDGIHRVLPAWIFSGGAVVLGSELAFAIFALVVASGTLGGTQTQDDDVLSTATKQGEKASTLASNFEEVSSPLSVLSESSPEDSKNTLPESGRPLLSVTKEIDTTDVLSEVELALEAAAVALEGKAEEDESSTEMRAAFSVGDMVEIIGGKDYCGMTATVLGERGQSGYWNLQLDCSGRTINIYRKFSNLQLLSKVGQEVNPLVTSIDTKELAQRKLLQARLRFEKMSTSARHVSAIS